MVAVWLVHVGQKLLLWGALSAVSLAAATLILNFLQMMARYGHNWLQMRPIPTIPGAYPFLGHVLILERGGKGKGLRARASCIPATGCGAPCREPPASPPGAAGLELQAAG